METKTSTKALVALFAAIEELRKIDPELPTQHAAAFITVAFQPGITMKEMADRLGISQSSSSRIVAALGKWHRLGKPGYDLVEASEDPAERRRKIMHLTPKGRRIAVALSNIMHWR